MAVSVKENTFESEVLKSDIPVVVDFWATWCGPCMMMGPVLEEVAEELKGKVKFCKVNVDENPSLAEKFGIMSIPNFILFKNGQNVAQRVGGCPKEELAAFANS